MIYLCSQENLPQEYVLKIHFGAQGSFEYRVGVVSLNHISTEELNHRKMVILIPFKLLKLRKELQKSRDKNNLTALKKLIQNDIIGSIEEKLAAIEAKKAIAEQKVAAAEGKIAEAEEKAAEAEEKAAEAEARAEKAEAEIVRLKALLAKKSE